MYSIMYDENANMITYDENDFLKYILAHEEKNSLCIRQKRFRYCIYK